MFTSLNSAHSSTQPKGRLHHGVLILMVLLPQDQQFRLLQTDVLVDPEVAQHLVLVLWVDLRGGGRGSRRRSQRGRPVLNQASQRGALRAFSAQDCL